VAAGDTPAMHQQALAGQVRQVMVDTFGIDDSDLPENPSQTNFARWTSLLHMVLLVALEEQFELTFSMDDMTSMTSLDRIVNIINARLAVGQLA
jgi:acyl carrier protein